MTRRPRSLLLLALVACAPKGPDIEVRDAYSYESVLGNVGAVYFTIENRGRAADTLADVEVTGALVAMIHDQVANGDMVEMRHLNVLPLPPRSTVVLAPGGLLCGTGLTPGESGLARFVSRAWAGVWARWPALVGGCRPIRLVDALNQADWQVHHHRTVVAWGVTSEILIATRR